MKEKKYFHSSPELLVEDLLYIDFLYFMQVNVLRARGTCQFRIYFFSV